MHAENFDSYIQNIVQCRLIIIKDFGIHEALRTDSKASEMPYNERLAYLLQEISNLTDMYANITANS